MKRIVERAAFGAFLFAASAAPLLAAPFRPRHTVPEIDASSGFMVMAAVVAVLALVAERRRRRTV